MTDEQVYSTMLRTMRDARRNKRYGRDCSAFERSWAAGLVRIMRQFRDRTFRVERNYAFLTSVPKWREIFATSFEGRLADHLLCDTLAPYIEKELHPRTFNNRKGKGAQAAMNQVIEDIYTASCGYTQPCRVIKWDLKGFFPNMLCSETERRLLAIIDKYADAIASEYDAAMPAFLKWLTMVCIHCNPAAHCELRTPRRLWAQHIAPEKSLFSKGEDVGAPIGRLTSQIGAGLQMNDEVRWLNDECGILATLFMDDCVMVVPERLHGYALALLPVLRKRLAAKGIEMNERKFYDQPYQHGLEFLGSHIKPHRIHLNNGTYSRAVERVKELNAERDKLGDLDKFVASVNSYTGLLKGRTDFKRLQSIRDLIDDKWWTMCFWNDKKQCLGYLPDYTIRQRLNNKYHLHLKHNDSRRNQQMHGDKYSPVGKAHPRKAAPRH